MTGWSGAQIWLVIAALGLGTYLIRFSFLGMIGDKPLPPFVLRLLRYTPVAVMPGLVAPLIVWPEATGGEPDAPRLAAAIVAMAVGWYSKSVIWAVLSGMAVLALGLNLI